MGDLIRLLDSSGEKVLDSVLCEYEDSFCLESFGELIQAHINSPHDPPAATSPTQPPPPTLPKSFIIARVQTWDHKQPEKAFYSYYDAYQLNKILFQTQIYLGKKLIHRLHVLNPLTNTDIIGNVQYFMVKGISTDAAEDSKGLGVLKEEDSTVESSNNNQQRSSTKKNKKKAPAPINTNFKTPFGPEYIKSPGVIEADSGKPANWTLSAPAVVEEERSAKSTTVIRKLSLIPRNSVKRGPLSAPPIEYAMTIPQKVLATAPNPEVEHDTIKNRDQKRAKSFSGNPEQHLNLEVIVNSRNKSLPGGTNSLKVHALVKPPTGPLVLNQSNKTNKQNIPNGLITRFAVPVPANEIKNMAPPTKKSRRRSLSYVNAVSASGVPASFKEWLEMVQEEKNNLDEREEDFDTVKLFSKKDSPSKPQTKKDFKIYDAVLFATDNDYLETSKIRAIFRENAINPEDVKLFEMPPFTGEDPVTPQNIVVYEPAVCEFCFPSSNALNNMTPGMRLFHQCKCYAFAALLMVGLFVFLFMGLRSNSSLTSTGSTTSTKTSTITTTKILQ
ncbi:hypothetical protein HK098_007219 [Nowakowskiella sp. JEL0407]|nr:hypothetical protein HK098_007219 [Nowakowskiella sp. JEL0407]